MADLEPALDLAADYPVVRFETDLLGAALLPRRATLDCLCVPPANQALDAGLSARLRGAWGQKLVQRADSGHSGASALLAHCFRNASNVRPYVIHLHHADINAIASLTLIGTADQWQEVAFECFLEALSEPEGIAISADKNARRRPWRLIEHSWRRHESTQPVPDQPIARLETLTPLKLMTGRSLSTDPSRLLASIARRVCALAVWSHARVRNAEEAVAAAQGHGSIRTIDAMPESFRTNSTNHLSTSHHAGLSGTYIAENLTPLGWALLNFGAAFGAGQDISKGMGQYRVMV